VHGFFSRDGITPAALLLAGREQLRQYTSVELRSGEVVDVQRQDAYFTVTLADGTREVARKVVLATGVRDELPAIEGFAQLWGTGVFHCPYCYGWEMRDRPLAIYGQGAQAFDLALLLTNWSDDLVLCSDGPIVLSEVERQQLSRHHIILREEPLARLEGHDGELERIVFANGEILARRGLFLRPGRRQHSPLAAQIGCPLTKSGGVETDEDGRTSIPGLYVIGDASHPIHWVSLAAAHGARAGIALSNELLKEKLA
jgi:thioredoxin reductase